jgi:hypothetical protein
MIKNIPHHSEFENLGIQCILKSFEMLYRLGNEYHEADTDENLKGEVSKSQFWKFNKITVNTSLIVLFQGVEYLMKMSITKHSALLLLENNRNEWPTLPSKKDKNFDELQTISGENLLAVFCATIPDGFNLDEFVKNYESLRIKRNMLVHSTGVKNLKHQFVLQQILFFITIFYSVEKCLPLLRENFVSDPYFGYWDSDIEGAQFVTVLDFLERELGKSGMKPYLNVNLKARRYCCPECTYWLNQHGEDYYPKWSFLKPNTPSSNVIECLICAENYEVTRKDCDKAGCKGNVLSSNRISDQCLTCFTED